MVLSMPDLPFVGSSLMVSGCFVSLRLEREGYVFLVSRLPLVWIVG